MENKTITEISSTRILGLLTFITSIVALIGMAFTNSKSDNYTSFWALLILFGIPALIYVIACTRSVIRGGAKYLIFRERKISSKPKKEEIDEAEQEKQAIKEKELTRTEKEKYSSSILKTRWTVMPLIMLFGAGIYVAIVYFSNDKEYVFDGFNTAIVIIGALGLLDIWGLSLQDEWEKKLEAKREIYQENKDYPFYDGYDYDLVYTDSKFSYLFYRFAKFLAYILGVAGIAILLGIIISLISGISISPTTIIIFLLVMIYFEVKKRNENNK